MWQHLQPQLFVALVLLKTQLKRSKVSGPFYLCPDKVETIENIESLEINRFHMQKNIQKKESYNFFHQTSFNCWLALLIAVVWCVTWQLQ